MLSKQLKLVSKQRAFLKLSYQSPLTTKLSNEISAGNKTQRDKREGGGGRLRAFVKVDAKPL